MLLRRAPETVKSCRKGKQAPRGCLFIFERKLSERFFSAGFRFRHEPRGMAGAEGGLCRFSLRAAQEEEKRRAAPCHEGGAVRAEFRRCVRKDRMVREERVFEGVVQGGRQARRIFFAESRGGLFAGPFRGGAFFVDGAVRGGGAHGGFGLHEEKGEAFPRGERREISADAGRAGAAAAHAEGHVRPEARPHGAERVHGEEPPGEAVQPAEHRRRIGGAAPEARFGGDALHEMDARAPERRPHGFEKERRRAPGEIVRAGRSRAGHGERQAVRRRKRHRIGEGHAVHERIDRMIAVGAPSEDGEGKVHFCAGGEGDRVHLDVLHAIIQKKRAASPPFSLYRFPLKKGMLMKRNDFRLNSYFFTTLVTIVGCLFYALGINLFFVPHHFIAGGFAGVAMIVYYLTGFPIGVANILLNIPILLLALRFMGRFYTVITIIATIAISVCIDLTSFLSDWEGVQDPLIAAISGGVLLGVGCGILYRYNSNSGGLDVIGAIVKKYYNLEIGYVVFALNCLIVAASGLFFSVETTISTLVAMYINATVSGRIVIGFAQRKAAFIVSEKPYEVADSLLRNLHHGATLLYGQGAYTGGDRKVLFAIINLTQISRLKWLIRRVDPHAFLFIMNTTDVIGRGFTSPLSRAATLDTNRYRPGPDGSLIPTEEWQQQLSREERGEPEPDAPHGRKEA